jgi:putative oxidoreductase
MTVSRRLARPMMAAMFVTGGLDAFQHPASKAPKAKTIAPAIAKPLGLPTDTETLVRLNGAVQVVAGSLFAAGKLPRLAALTLAASLVPTTLAGHRFWEETDPQARVTQRIHFLKNVSMLGGFLIAAGDTEGRPSLSWRARRTAARARHALPAVH